MVTSSPASDHNHQPNKTMKTTTIAAYAVQIQPRTGQQIAEFNGIEIDARDWTDADAKRFPQAARQLWEGAKLVVDRATKEVYAVDA
jgi:hypothetical protein